MVPALHRCQINSKFMKTMSRSASRSREQTQRSAATLRWSPAALALAALLVLVFATGGASRADVASLAVLRPAATGFLFLGLYWLRPEHWRANRFLLGWAAAITLVALAQLVPLPSQVWQALPGRALIADIDRVVGLGDIWRPLTMTPAATRNAFWSLMPPLACLVLAVQLDRREHQQVMALIIGIGLMSALLAMLQLLGDPRGPLYLYDFTNNGIAVGLFANRNHQALLLAALLPMLAVWAFTETSQRDGRKQSGAGMRRIAALGAAGFIIPLILITGSRAGIVLGLTALVIAGIIMVRALPRRAPGNPERGAKAHKSGLWLSGKSLPKVAAGLLLGGAAALISLTVALNRDLAIDRLLERDIAEDGRAKTLPTAIAITQLYLPWGSGFGSFEQVYQVHEPDALLGPTYMNHAHNDWLELVQTGGVPALLLLAAVLGWCALTLQRYGWSAQVGRDNRRLAQVGASFLLLAGAGSVGDYPLRAPSLACLMVLALVWIGQLRGATRPGASSRLETSR